MYIVTKKCVLRDWSTHDAPSLASHANNPDIARWMRDGFPSPYTREDADNFIAIATSIKAGIILAIEVNGEVVGGIGVHPLQDVYRRTAEIGYWLTPSFQGKGIATCAVQEVVRVAFEMLNIIRIQAGVFHTNLPSMRVLDKCGFVPEAIHKKAIFKNGKVLDECMYVIFKDQEG